MSDTPRTDAGATFAQFFEQSELRATEVVNAKIARDLERETVALRAERDAAIREIGEQARLLGISGSREAALMAEVERLRAELETERMRLNACGVVAMANTPESAAQAREMLPEYRSASLRDVERAVDSEIALRAEVERLWKSLRQIADGEFYSEDGAMLVARAALAATEAK